MTLGAMIGSLKTSVRRLEVLAGKGARCGLCRIGLRLLPIGSEKETGRAEGAVKVKCEFCHNEFLRSLKGIPESDREFYRLTYPFTMDDEFTDPRAHAADLWRAYRPWPWEEEGGAARHQGAEWKAKKDPRVRTLNALRDQYQEACVRKRKRLVLRYGADPFPEHRRLVESTKQRARDARGEEPYVPGLQELRTGETRYLVCAELEKIIIGRVLLSTQESIGRLRARINEMVDGARRDREGKEAEERRVKEERRRLEEERPPQEEPRVGGGDEPVRSNNIPHRQNRPYPSAWSKIMASRGLRIRKPQSRR